MSPTRVRWTWTLIGLLVAALPPLAAEQAERPTAAGGAASQHQTRVAVPAGAAWVDTSVALEEGEAFTIEAEGTWSMATDDRPFVTDADGAKRCTYQKRPLGALLGRVAGLPGPAQLLLGTRVERKAPSSGILYLLPNSLWWLREQQKGELTVSIRGGRPADAELRARRRDAELAAIRTRILRRCNALRARMGLPPATLLAALVRSAQGHAEYVDRHEYSHQEKPGKEGFLGVEPWDRMRACGYEGACGEVIACEDTPEDAFDVWAASVYHRQFVTHPSLSSIGVGAYGRMHVINYSLDTQVRTEAVALCPPRDDQDVPLSWPGLESPSPIPEGAATPVGYTVSAHFPAEVKAVREMRLKGPDGAAVRCWVRHRLNDTALRYSNATFLLPEAPLQPGATYEALVAADTAEGAKELRWSFTTAVAERSLEVEQFVAPRRPLLPCSEIDHSGFRGRTAKWSSHHSCPAR